MKKLLISIAFLLICSSHIFAEEWEMPCDNGCEGTWELDSLSFFDFSCPPCKVTIFYYFRNAVCPGGGNELQYYPGRLESNGCDTCSWNFSTMMDIAFSYLTNYLITNNPHIPVMQMFLESCWSQNLFGPHPVAQPCEFTDCCKYKYIVFRDEQGEIDSVKQEAILSTIDCQNVPPVGECINSCNPNGYLYKLSEAHNIDLMGLHNSKIYPNPAKELITLDFNFQDNGIFSFQVFDINGSRLLDINFTKESKKFIESFDVSNFESGTYFYHILSQGKKISIGNFVIQ